MLGVVLTASCAAAFKVPAARPAIVWRATMVKLSQDEKDRRDAACQEVLKFAAENEAVSSIAQCAIIVQGKTSMRSAILAKETLRVFRNALPEDDPLRAAYDAVVARATSTESRSACARSQQARGRGKSIPEMREARVTYAARPLPTLTVSSQRLVLEFQRGIAATVATPQKQLEGLEECACNEAFESVEASFEERVGIVESAGATNVPEQGYCLVSNELIGHAAGVWDAQHARNERAILMEGHLQEHYGNETDKMAEPRRKASARGRKQAHASRFDAHGGGKAVLAAPVALTKAPGSFVSMTVGSKRSYDSLKEIADAVEAEQKIRAVSRVNCQPHRRTELYGRVRPTALSEGSDQCPIKQRSVPIYMY